jgi:predicted RecA/RadA family phage recombinase
MQNFIKPGDVVTVPAPAEVVSGQGVLVGSLFGVAQHDAESAADVELVLRGVFDMPKADEQAWTVGVRIYWDDTEGECTTDSDEAANKLIGVALEALADTAGIVEGRVYLTGAFTT